MTSMGDWTGRTGNSWAETAKFTAAPPTYREEGYGISVAVDGDTIAVGASRRQFNNDVTATYLYQRTASGWAQTDRRPIDEVVRKDETVG